jgi:hypothetical protein
MKTRELKFRAWYNVQKKFEYFELHNIFVSDRLLCQHSYPVQQFTGMLDKNGKEIYEGDIIKGTFYIGLGVIKGIFYIDPGSKMTNTATVQWTNEEGYQWNYWDLTTIEIVGNIFEQ